MSSGVLKDKWCLITGAGKGVGAAIAEVYAKEHANLVLVARSEDELNEKAEKCKSLGAGAVEVETTNLMDDKAVDDLCATLLERHGTVDVLVNNAGRAAWTGQGPTDGELDDWQQMLKLNLEVPMRLTRRLSPAMVKKGSGTAIINLGSKAGREPVPMQCVYATCKHGLRGWSLSCHEALREHGVKVIVIEPGYIDTPMTGIAELDKLDHTKMMKPEDVAEVALLPFRISASCVPAEVYLSNGPSVENS